MLIDTAGMSQRDTRVDEQMGTLHECSPLLRSCLVLSANTQSRTLTEVVQAFAQVELDSCIITKLDEAASLGGVVSAVIRSGIPVAYIGDGQRVPEDLHPARAYTLISKAVTLAQSLHPAFDDNHENYTEKMANAHV